MQRIVASGVIMDSYRPLRGSAEVLPDRRLLDRLAWMVLTFTQQPACTIPQATSSRNSMDATYDFFKNRRVCPENIVASCLPDTRTNLQGCCRVLAIQDASEGNFDTLSQTTGLGYTDGHATRGLKFHSTLAVRSDGLVAGLLTQQVWTRPFEAKGRAAKRRQRDAEDKESFRWQDHAQAARQAVPAEVVLIHVADREGDIYDWLAAPRPANTHLLVRVAQAQRVVVYGPLGQRGHLAEVVAEQALLGQQVITVPRADDRPQRQANLSLRVAKVEIQPPKHAKGRRQMPGVEAWIVEAREEQPPAGSTAVHWRLVTTEPILSWEQAVQALSEYQLRWRIERFHFVLKSGCGIERLELSTAERLANAVAVYSQVAVRIMRLTYLARIEPEAEASKEFSVEELRVLEAEQQRRNKQATGPLRTIREAVRVVAQMGGHLGRQGDGPPGLKVLWRGLLALHHRILGFRLGQSTPLSSTKYP